MLFIFIINYTQNLKKPTKKSSLYTYNTIPYHTHATPTKCTSAARAFFPRPSAVKVRRTVGSRPPLSPRSRERVIRALLSLSARAQVHRTRAMTVDARAHAAAASERALAGTRLCSRDLAHSMHSASDASAFIRRRRRESGEVFFWGEVKEGRRRGEV